MVAPLSFAAPLPIAVRAGTPTSAILGWFPSVSVPGRLIAVVATQIPTFRRDGRPHTISGDPNGKIGRGVTQIWYLVVGVSPFAAMASGADRANCGSCAHRPSLVARDERPAIDRCYLSKQVRQGKGPSRVYRALMSGAYRVATDADRAAIAANPHGVRLGAYGDPLSIGIAPYRDGGPLAFLRGNPVRAGYTQRWRSLPSADRALAASFLAASVSDAATYRLAVRAGFRAFLAGDPGDSGALPCLALRDGWTCSRCLRVGAGCDGKRGPDDRRPGRYVPLHG